MIASVLSWILQIGVAAAGVLILGGLALRKDAVQEAGILALLATPAVALGAALVLYVRKKDWRVAGACLVVIAVLGMTVFLAV